MTRKILYMAHPVAPTPAEITKDPVSDSIECEYIIIDNSREARMIAFLLCEAADKLEAQ